MATIKRTPEAWTAIEHAAREDQIDEFLAEAQGSATPPPPRPAWQVQAAAGLARDRARIDALQGRYAGLPRADLLARIAVARAHPRFAQPVAVMFRNRKAEEAGEDELRAILEELDALAALAGDGEP